MRSGSSGPGNLGLGIYQHLSSRESCAFTSLIVSTSSSPKGSNSNVWLFKPSWFPKAQALHLFSCLELEIGLNRFLFLLFKLLNILLLGRQGACAFLQTKLQGQGQSQRQEKWSPLTCGGGLPSALTLGDSGAWIKIPQKKKPKSIALKLLKTQAAALK